MLESSVQHEARSGPLTARPGKIYSIHQPKPGLNFRIWVWGLRVRVIFGWTRMTRIFIRIRYGLVKFGSSHIWVTPVWGIRFGSYLSQPEWPDYLFRSGMGWKNLGQVIFESPQVTCIFSMFFIKKFKIFKFRSTLCDPNIIQIGFGSARIFFGLCMGRPYLDQVIFGLIRNRPASIARSTDSRSDQF